MYQFNTAVFSCELESNLIIHIACLSVRRSVYPISFYTISREEIDQGRMTVIFGIFFLCYDGQIQTSSYSTQCAGLGINSLLQIMSFVPKIIIWSPTFLPMSPKIALIFGNLALKKALIFCLGPLDSLRIWSAITK